VGTERRDRNDRYGMLGFRVIEQGGHEGAEANYVWDSAERNHK
jgi:hypothetical protein